MSDPGPISIRTPDQRVRVFVSSTLEELAPERAAAREAIEQLRLTPVMFELGAAAHPPRDLYRAYLAQSDVFVGIYWQRYGWVAPGMTISGLEDEYQLAGGMPRLIYLKQPAPDREPQLVALLDHIRSDDGASYKSFATPEELHAQLAGDVALLLSERFAHRATSGITPRGNLPVEREPPLGRTQETTMLHDLLLRDGTGLVTIVGPGGVGKTRLALHVATLLADRFADGVFFVSLGAVREAALVVPTIAQVVGLREGDGRATDDALADVLRDKHVLLVLDNLEQVVDAAPVVPRLLDISPGLKILATSREGLHVRGEKVVTLAPLVLPEHDDRPSAEAIAKSPAVALFVERAQNSRPEFTLNAATAPTVAAIVRRLDGLPLALELAAARLSVLSPEALLTRLEHRLPVLIGGARDLPARQRTLQDTIGWSYDLLSPLEQVAFRRLAVFADGWTLEAAEAVCVLGADGVNDQQVGDMLDVLGTLVSKSLVQVEGGAAPRFSMLETIREFALQRLSESAERDAIATRHNAYFTALVAAADPELRSANRPIWLERLDAERENIRVTLARARSDPDAAEGFLRVTGDLALFWYMRGTLSEGRAWLADALAMAKSGMSAYVRARVYYGAGLLAWAQGDLSEIDDLFGQALALFKELDDQRWSGYTLSQQGLVALRRGNLTQARDMQEECLACVRAANDTWGEAFALRNYAEALYLTGDVTAARQHFQESQTLWRAVGDPWGLALELLGQAEMDATSGDAPAARPLYEECIALLRQVGDSWSLGLALNGLGHVMLGQGDVEAAHRAFAESLILQQRLGDRTGVAATLIALAEVAAVAGDWDSCARLLGAAMQSAEPELLETQARTALSRCADAARKALGDEAFAAASAAGRAQNINSLIVGRQ